MENTLIDTLNKILTNTLEYQELLKDIAETVADKTTEKKLMELAEVKEKQSEELIKMISALGGDVESTERITDQESISWTSRPIPDTGDMEAILSLLIEAEKNARQDYQETLDRNDFDNEFRKELETHLQEAEANLKYFETARESL